MKDTLTDANFPRTADQRVYHLGLRPGEVANRIIIVGTPSRAETIAACFDKSPKTFTLSSERGFLTMTGRYKGAPISIVSIGMGFPNTDFFVRECRECLSGDMVIVRLGSCGALIDIPVGSVVIPKASVAVTRNVDFDFVNPEENNELPYRISKPTFADPELHAKLREALEAARPSPRSQILAETVNASADSFYSSQGRKTSFPDSNDDLIERLQTSVKDLATFEMETFHLFHLAACWQNPKAPSSSIAPPLATGPVVPNISRASNPTQQPLVLAAPDSVIRAAAAQMVFASRTSQDFITPQEVTDLEAWTGRGVLDALSSFEIPSSRLHPEAGSVWDLD